MTNIPQTMKAIRIHRAGGPNALSLDTVPTPTAGPGQVLIRVESAAVNFADVKRRRGDDYPFPTVFPFTPGAEVAGTVAAVGPDTAAPPVGTRVMSMVGNGSGGYAQFAQAQAEAVIPLPPGLEPDEAAGMILAGTTAMLILREVARVKRGETVFIPATSGGVGSVLVQAAVHAGARVVAGASTPEKRARAQALGAHHTVDSRASDWAAQVRDATAGKGADVVLEATGGKALEQALGALAPFGRLVVYGAASGTQGELSAEAIRALFYNPSPNQSVVSFNVGGWFMERMPAVQEAVRALMGMRMEGRLKVEVTETFGLHSAAKAHARMESRASSGKLVLHPWA
jgi:NADPH2:quinone reductase